MDVETTESTEQVTPESVETEVTETTETQTDKQTETTEQSTDKPSAPESYEDFSVPEGFTFDKDSAGEFNAVAKELDLSQDQAQKLVDLYGAKMLGQLESQQKQAEQWATESKKEFKPAEIDLANKTLGRFADKEMIELLATTGLGNHPKMVALFKTIGGKISEAPIVDAQTSQKPSGVLYKNSPEMYE